jgi:hypothetical protein
LPVREVQFVQERIGQVRIRFVPDAAFNAHTGGLLVKRLKERIGESEVVLEPVVSIPRGPNGKFRAVLNRLNMHELNVK